MLRRLALLAVFTLAASAFAEDKKDEKAAAPAADAKAPDNRPPPSAQAIRDVIDYLDNGKDRGPALLDVIPCLKVDNTKGSPTQFQCVEPITAAVPKNTTVFAWLQWYCPKDGKYEDVQIQFMHEGQVRQTIDVPVAGYGKTRGWRGANFNKVGKWTIRVSRGDKELGTATVDVASN